MKKLTLGIVIAVFIALVGIRFNHYRTSENILLANVEALAFSEDSEVWFREDNNCVYKFKGEKGATFTLTIGGMSVSGQYDKWGEFEYILEGGETRCTPGGRIACIPYNCPSVIK